MQTLSPEELREGLSTIPTWGIDHGKLTHQWKFPSFADAMAFVTQVAALAERLDHHPDIQISYTLVTLTLISHDAQALTRRDLKFAKALDHEMGVDPPGSSSDPLRSTKI